MIKFFRKIRQQLLLENKTGKYFKYAIGEIVLVVIGILIAVGINNKVDDYRNIATERFHLKSLLIELEQIEKQIQKEDNILKERVMSHCTYILEQIHLQKRMAPSDSLNKAMFNIISLPNSEIVFKTFDNLVNTNELALIRSNGIKSSLSDVARAILFQTEAMDWQAEQWNSINQPYINKHLEFLDISPKSVKEEHNAPNSAFENDWNLIIKDKEFRNLVYNRLLAAGDVTHSTSILLKKIDFCKMQIRQELSDRLRENP
jgi:hypothetical protein